MKSIKSPLSKLLLSLVVLATSALVSPQAQAEPTKLYFAKNASCAQNGFSVSGDMLVLLKSCKAPVSKTKLADQGPFDDDFDEAKFFERNRNSLKVTHGVSDTKDNYDYRVSYEEGSVYVELGVNRSLQLTTGLIKRVDLEGATEESVLFGLDRFKLGARAQAADLSVAAKQGLLLGTVPKLTANGNFMQESGSLVGKVSGKRLKDSNLPLEYNQQVGALTYEVLHACRVKLAGVTVNTVHAGRAEVLPTAVLPQVVIVKDELVLHKNPAQLTGTKHLEKTTRDLAKQLAGFVYDGKLNLASKLESVLSGIQANNPSTQTYLASFNMGTLVIDVPAGEEFKLDLDRVPILGFSKIHKRGSGRLVIQGTGKKKFAEPTGFGEYLYEDADGKFSAPETVTVTSEDSNISAPDLKPTNVRSFNFTRPYLLNPTWAIALKTYFAESRNFQILEVPWRNGAPDYFTYCDDEDWKYHDVTDESEANADQAKAN